MNRHDDSIRRLQESVLHRVSRQRLVTPTRGVRDTKRDSRADLFAFMAEQFVEQVKSIARIDDDPSEEEEDEDNDDIISIELGTSIKQEPDQALEAMLEVGDLPGPAANRVIEVLKKDFGISAKEPAPLQRAGRSRNTSDGQLTPSTSATASRDLSLDRSREVEMREVKKEPIIHSNLLPTRQAQTSYNDAARSINSLDEKLDRLAGKLADSIADALATKIGKISESCSCCKSSSSTSDNHQVQASTSSKNLVQEAAEPSTSAASHERDPDPSQSESACSTQARSKDPEDPSSSDEESEQVDFASSAGFADAKRDTTPSCSMSSRPRQQPSRYAKDCTIIAQDRVQRAQAPVHSGHSEAKAADSSAQTSSSLSGGGALWDEKIEKIFRNSKSIRVFSKNLMHHFFNASELIECYNVYGRVNCGSVESDATRRPLDPKRVNMIRQLVQLKVKLSKKLWSRCVDSMNQHITSLKQKMRKHDGRRIAERAKLYPKQKPNLKKSRVYEENNLSYKEINNVYIESRSMTNFARNLMLHLFTRAELRECHNVYGRIQRCSMPTERCLDERRVEFIHRIVTENCTHDGPSLWRICICILNQEITKVKRE